MPRQGSKDTKRSKFGSITLLRSGKWWARYTDPGTGARQSLGTFGKKGDAEKALRKAEADLDRGERVAVRVAVPTFAELAAQVMEHREDDLRPGTRRNHRSLMKTVLLPAFGALPVDKITRARIDRWWSSPAMRAHPVNRKNAGHVLATILRFGERWEYIGKSPFDVPGASADVSQPRPVFTIGDFKNTVARLEPDLQRAAWVLLSGHLRIGELCGLQAKDWDPATGTLRIERQLSDVGGRHLAEPKTDSSRRTVTLLEPGAQAIREQLAERPAIGAAPLFPGPRIDVLRPAYFREMWKAAATAAGLPDFTPHDCRHVGLTLAAQSGATLRELMARGGHSTASSAIRYQGTTRERDAAVARAASELLAEEG